MDSLSLSFRFCLQRHRKYWIRVFTVWKWGRHKVTSVSDQDHVETSPDTFIYLWSYPLSNPLQDLRMMGSVGRFMTGRVTGSNRCFFVLVFIGLKSVVTPWFSRHFKSLPHHLYLLFIPKRFSSSLESMDRPFKQNIFKT